MKKSKLLLGIMSLLFLVTIALSVLNGLVYFALNKEYEFEGNLHEQVNTVRAIYDLNGLTQTDELNNIAKAKCDDMVNRNYYSHETPDGLMVWEQFDYSYNTTGENLANGIGSAYAVTQSWVNSPKHKENLINPNYTEVGYGICRDKNQFKVVQILKG